MHQPLSSNPLRALFSSAVERAFLQKLGVYEPGVTDYLAGLLTDFAHVEHFQKMKNWDGKPLQNVAEMLTEAAGEAGARREREIHRFIGDLTLFWTGLYPEALKKRTRADIWINYAAQGKASYARAAAWETGDFPPPAAVLRKLSEDYELCVQGLTLVRREIDDLARIKPS